MFDMSNTSNKPNTSNTSNTSNMPELIVISLGGSIIVPDKVDTSFLRNFRNFIMRQIKKGRRFIIMCGGGRTARNYIGAASEIRKIGSVDLDWIGIHATRLNAQLLRAVFKDVAFDKIVKDPTKTVKTRAAVIVAAGWKPGVSTDYDAVILSEAYGSKVILNLTDVDYAYDKNPKQHADARPLKEVSWKHFRKIVGNKWSPGLSSPFDPVASRLAEKLKLKVIILNGRNIKNIDNFLNGSPFIGTIIR
jgi:uridylate kinase